MPPVNDKKAGGGRRTLVLLAAACAVVLLLGAGALWLATAPEAGTNDIGGPFALTDGQGKPVTDRDLRGQYLLVYFGYTFCPDVCPTTLQHVTEAMRQLGPKAAQVTPVFITVDPKRDTPKVVGDYVAGFSPRLIGLTGSPAAIEAVEREYHVYAAAQPAEDGKGDYSVDHSSVLYLMGPDGHFLAPIAADDSGKDIAGEVAQHMTG
jgi:protein SCO1/2